MQFKTNYLRKQILSWQTFLYISREFQSSFLRNNTNAFARPFLTGSYKVLVLRLGLSLLLSIKMDFHKLVHKGYFIQVLRLDLLDFYFTRKTLGLRLDQTWTRLGPNSGKTWTKLGPNLEQTCIKLGHDLDMTWTWLQELELPDLHLQVLQLTRCLRLNLLLVLFHVNKTKDQL